MKSVKQACQVLHLSRGGLYKRIKKIPDFKKKYTQKNKNKVIISNAGISALASLKTVRPAHHKLSKSFVTKSDYRQKVNELKRVIKYQRSILDQIVSNNKMLAKRIAGRSADDRPLPSAGKKYKTEINYQRSKIDKQKRKLNKMSDYGQLQLENRKLRNQLGMKQKNKKLMKEVRNNDMKGGYDDKDIGLWSSIRQIFKKLWR